MKLLMWARWQMVLCRCRCQRRSTHRHLYRKFVLCFISPYVDNDIIFAFGVSYLWIFNGGCISVVVGRTWRQRWCSLGTNRGWIKWLVQLSTSGIVVSVVVYCRLHFCYVKSFARLVLTFCIVNIRHLHMCPLKWLLHMSSEHASIGSRLTRASPTASTYDKPYIQVDSDIQWVAKSE